MTEINVRNQIHQSGYWGDQKDSLSGGSGVVFGNTDFMIHLAVSGGWWPHVSGCPETPETLRPCVDGILALLYEFCCSVSGLD